MTGCCGDCWGLLRSNRIATDVELSVPNERDELHGVEAWRRAACYVDDAVHSRGPFGMVMASKLEPYRQRCFRWVSNNRIRYAYFLVITAHCLLAIFEPVQKHIPAGRTHPAVWAIHALCLILYIADTVIHFLFYGCRAFWKLTQTRRCRGEFVLVCLFLIDFVILIVQDALGRRLVAPFRCTRFSMIICHHSGCEHIFTITLQVLTQILKIFLVFIIFITVFACIGIHMYANDYHFIGCSNCTSDTLDTKPFFRSFDHIGFGFIRVFGLLTTENYPTIMIPAFKRSQFNIFYFGVFIYLGNFVLLPILLAIIVNAYWKTAISTVKAEREQDRKCLARAWTILDLSDSASIPLTSEALYGVLRSYNEKNTDKDIRNILEELDSNHDQYISVLDWTLRLCAVLRSRTTSSFQLEADRPLSPNQERCRKFLQSKIHEYGAGVLIIIYGILFTVHSHGWKNGQTLVVQIFRSAIVVVFVIELVITILVQPRSYFRSKTSIAKLIFILTAFLATFIWYLLNYLLTSNGRDYALGLTTSIASLSILMYLPLHYAYIRKVCDIFLSCLPVMFALVLVLLTVLYAYSIIGLEAFYERQPSDEGVNTEIYKGCGQGFQTFLCSSLTVFQILVTNDWHNIQNTVMENVKSQLPAIYFITCFIIINYVIGNLLIAIAVEAYKRLGEQESQDQSQNKDNIPDNSPVTDMPRIEIRPPSGQPSTQIQRSPSNFTDRTTTAVQLHDTTRMVDRERPSANVRDDIIRRRRLSREQIKVTMPYRFNEKTDHTFITVHEGDLIEQLIDKKEFVHARTSRSRTGWFPAECVPDLRKRLSGAPPCQNQPAKQVGWKFSIVGSITELSTGEAIRISRLLKSFSSSVMVQGSRELQDSARSWNTEAIPNVASPEDKSSRSASQSPTTSRQGDTVDVSHWIREVVDNVEELPQAEAIKFVQLLESVTEEIKAQRPDLVDLPVEEDLQSEADVQATDDRPTADKRSKEQAVRIQYSDLVEAEPRARKKKTEKGESSQCLSPDNVYSQSRHQDADGPAEFVSDSRPQADDGMPEWARKFQNMTPISLDGGASTSRTESADPDQKC